MVFFVLTSGKSEPVSNADDATSQPKKRPFFIVLSDSDDEASTSKKPKQGPDPSSIVSLFPSSSPWCCSQKKSVVEYGINLVDGEALLTKLVGLPSVKTKSKVNMKEVYRAVKGLLHM